MDPKYIEPLVRRAMTEKFPDSLISLIEILKRVPVGGLPSSIPGIGENLNDAIRQLIYENIYTIKGNTMDPISELDIIQKLADSLEQSKKDFIEVVFPVENRNVYDLFCKLVSYSVSMKFGNTLKKCAKILKMTDLMHPLRIALVTWLRADFCQISHVNLDDLSELPQMSKELAAVFISTLCLQNVIPKEPALIKLTAEWLYTEPELIAMVRPQTSNLICWCLVSRCEDIIDESASWKFHLSLLQGFQQRALRGKKHAYLSGSDLKTWADCIKTNPNPTVVDMILQLLQVARYTNALHVTKEEIDQCLANIPKTELYTILEQTKALEIS